MIKIIKSGTKKRVTCKECGAILEYQQEDICSVRTGMAEYEYYVVCPCCENEITVKAFIQ